ncbi:10411_t:CDS:2 [Diversispora eburnea]|uniref:AP complex subunit sigma n=1 Tax=Diversispora eburnea TaxID=1213867 RepID=A0A9N8V0Z2_9GLOM|nr:10411_t:CDS:2 [Diversispora eburnea]
MVNFFLLINKQGQTRFSRYYTKNLMKAEERVSMEAEIARKCLKRSDNQCSIFDYNQYKLAYRRYASLFFIIGFDDKENHFSILELVQAFVEKVHIVLEEMIVNGCIVETNKNHVLSLIMDMNTKT